jgi:hypothetical protein
LSCSVSTARKVSVPSRRQPERSFRSTGWRVGEAMNSSSRVNTSFTGRRVMRARKMADRLEGIDIELRAEGATDRRLHDADTSRVDTEQSLRIPACAGTAPAYWNAAAGCHWPSNSAITPDTPMQQCVT